VCWYVLRHREQCVFIPAAAKFSFFFYLFFEQFGNGDAVEQLPSVCFSMVLLSVIVFGTINVALK
jgi:hypothetical protein